MLTRLHLVFVGYLGLALVWNLLASARPVEEGRRRPTWERLVLLPVQLGLTVVLVLDRRGGGPSLLVEHGWIAHLFPALCLGALVQNVHAMLTRGARLTDIPMVLWNVGLGAALMVADLALMGVPLGQREAALLHAYAVVQGLLGTRLHLLWTLSWHLPLFCRRGAITGLADGAASLLPASVAAFGVLMLTLLARPAAETLDSFDAEPRVTSVPGELAVAVSDVPGRAPAPGSWTAWRVPLDAVDDLVPPSDGRPLLVELVAPRAWHSEPPDASRARVAFLDGARRATAALHPAVLLPFPEPDGEGTLWFGLRTDWRDMLAAVRAELGDDGPRIGLRLAGTSGASERIARSLLHAPAVVDVIGPRLEPGGYAAGRSAFADTSLETWRTWLGPLGERPAELWILGAGLSPLAYGEQAQERFLEGCLARALADDVAGVVLDTWHDDRHTLSVLRPGGTPRWAGRRLVELLGDPPRTR